MTSRTTCTGSRSTATRSSKTRSSPSSSTRCARDLERLERFFAVEPAANSFEGHHTLRLYNLLAFDRVFELVPVHRHVLPIVEGVLDPGLPDLVAVVDLDPTGRDRAADPRRRPAHPDPEAAPAHGVQLDVGAHRLHRGERRDPDHPGTHLADHSPDYGAEYDSIAAEMAGSVLIWHGSLWHGGGANTTDETRMGIAMNYCAGYIRQQENQQLGLSRETVSRFSPRLRELVGYSVYNMLIGHINKQSPEQLLLDSRRVAKSNAAEPSPPASPMVWDRI